MAVKFEIIFLYSMKNDICLLYLQTKYDLRGENVQNINLVNVTIKAGTQCKITGTKCLTNIMVPLLLLPPLRFHHFCRLSKHTALEN